MRVNNEFGMNQYEQIIMNYNMKMQNAFMNPNMMQYAQMQQKQFEMKNMMNRYGMNYARTMNNERKFVLETEF